MTRLFKTALGFLLLIILTTGGAFAQGGANSSMTGVVVDTGGGVIPGATVVAKNDATTASSSTVTSSNGTFVIPALAVGTYTVNVSLPGFKTAVLKAVKVTAGAPASLRATLEIGGIETNVTVEGAAQIIQTQGSSASATISSDQIINLPLGSRNALDFVAFLPGVQTASTVRNSEVNGLPQSTIAITMDGISIQDNYLKTSDGFFARMSPRLDAVEEVTVTTAGTSADANAQGATQIKFTTRSGGNRFTGSVYEYNQSDKFNSNTWLNKKSNLAKPTILQNQPGFRAGGPVVIPGLYDGHSQLFFFGNYEELHQPSSITDSSNLLTTTAQSGIFQYTASGATQSVNLYTLASSLGLTSTPDPLIARLLGEIRASTLTTGNVAPLPGNFVTERLTFTQPTKSLNRYPTIRMDYNLTSKHHIVGSYNRNNILSTPDTTNGIETTFPGFPATAEQASIRYTWSGNFRSTLGANLVNDFHIGGSGGPTKFSPSLVASMFNGSVASMNGYAIALPGLSSASPTNAYPSSTKSSREGSTKVFEDTLNWLHGSHSVSLGGGLTQADVWLLSQTVVPTLTLGTASGDPATSTMFTAANFPGSSSTNRSDAQALYNLLTGRISSVSGTFRLNPSTGEYIYNGNGLAAGRLREFDFFAQDSWRIKPNLSLNAGLRYVLQRPFYSKNSAYSTATLDDIWGVSGNLASCDPSNPTPATCNLFKAGTLPGKAPTFQNLGKGVEGYRTDWNNVAPTIGVNWTPEVHGGFWKKMLGTQGTTSFQTGWNRSYERRGMSDFTGVFGGNPGLTTTLARSTGNGNLTPVPHLLRDGDLAPAAYCSGTQTPTLNGCVFKTPQYPVTAVITGSANIFDPNLQVPYADTYTVGMQRALGKKSAFEVRYVGTRYRDSWTSYNMNETNINENGFLNEFRLAQGNLQANIAAGRGATFAYTGIPGTSPLPIYLAYFSGTPASQAGDTSKYTSSNWSNSNFVNPLAYYNSNPFTPAGTNSNTGLSGDPARRAFAAAAGLPANLFIANPDLQGGANVTGNGGFTRYNSLQTQFRRRLSNGLQFDANYSFGRAWTSSRYSFRVPRKETQQTGTGGDVTQALKLTWIYELPFGRGKHFATDANALVDRLVGGWSVNGTSRVQSGRLTDLGNVRVVGMSLADAQKAFKLRKGSDGEYYMWPQDIIDNTLKAYNTTPATVSGFAGDAPTGRYFIRANGPDCIESIANGYGDCGVRTLVLTGPVWKNVDVSVIKRVNVVGHTNAEIHFDVLNALKISNLTPTTGVGATALSSYQIISTNPNNAASQRVVQIQTRFNW